MSQRIEPEVLEYERFVDGLRRRNALMRAMMQKLIAKADHLISAIDGTTDQFEAETAALSLAATEAERLIEEAKDAAVPELKTITVHLERGLVQDVADIPVGYQVRIEDYDDGDTSHPSWDAKEECFVTTYESGAD